MKKIILIFAILITILGFNSSLTANLSNSSDKLDMIYNQNFVDDWDILDQFNHKISVGYTTVVNNYADKAQSFKPSIGRLTRVKLLMYDSYSPAYDINLYIQRELNLPPLTYVSKSSSEIPDYPETPEWIEFDFPDIDVIEEALYYIVLMTDGMDYFFCVGIDNLYTRGFLCYREIGNDWEYAFDRDLCFETYGYPKFQKSLIIGRIYDLDSTDDEVIKCRAEKIRVLTLSPFSFNTYNSDERIIIKKPKTGILSTSFIFTFNDASVF